MTSSQISSRCNCADVRVRVCHVRGRAAQGPVSYQPMLSEAFEILGSKPPASWLSTVREVLNGQFGDVTN